MRSFFPAGGAPAGRAPKVLWSAIGQMPAQRRPEEPSSSAPLLGRTGRDSTEGLMF